jgi:hypothetical protein
MTTLFSLEGALVEKAHNKLRTTITLALRPLRNLIDTVPEQAAVQDFRKTINMLEGRLFTELRNVAERVEFDNFVATYDQVADIVNASKAKAPPPSKDD